MNVLNESNAGQTITLPLGDVVSVRLAENPTTGSTWTAPQFDETCLTLDDDRYVANAEDTVGGGGVREFAFRAVRAGQTQVRTMLKRPWEDDARAQSAYGVTVIVR
jgi:inhibitor of cysteine peptidase